MTVERWAIGMAEPSGRITYRYTVGGERELLSYIARPEVAATRIGEAYPNVTALRRFLYSRHARRQLETARDLPGYVAGVVIEPSCDIALLYTSNGYVGWNVAGERRRRLQERSARLLAQANALARDDRDGFERAGGRGSRPFPWAVEDAEKLLEQARVASVESDSDGQIARRIWVAQHELNLHTWRRWPNPTGCYLNEWLLDLEELREAQRVRIRESTLSSLWLPGSTTWLFHGAEMLQALDRASEDVAEARSALRVAGEAAALSEHARPGRGAALRRESRTKAEEARTSAARSLMALEHLPYADTGLRPELRKLVWECERASKARTVARLVGFAETASEAASDATAAVAHAHRAAAVAIKATTAAVAGR